MKTIGFSGSRLSISRLGRFGISATLGASAILTVALLPRVAAATTYTVTTNSVCSLQEAILASTTMDDGNGDCPAGSGEDFIFLGAGTYVSAVPLEVGQNLTIHGAGIGATVIKTSNGSWSSELFSVTPGATLGLWNASLQKGTGGEPATGIYSFEGSVNIRYVSISGFNWSGIRMDHASAAATGVDVEHSVIESNSTPYDGGGIFTGVNNSLFVENTTISNNTALGWGGGIYHEGWGNSNVNHTTVTGNSAARGGGFYNRAQGSGGNYVNTFRSTFAGNSATISGGGVVEDSAATTVFGLVGDIIADNTAPVNPNFQGDGFASGSVFGVVGPDAHITNGSHPNLVNITTSQLKLGSLVSMGGQAPNRVRPLLKGSVAIDLTPLDSGILDQRGVDAQDGNNDGSVLTDAGAYEANLRWESGFFGITQYSDTNDIEFNSGYSDSTGLVLHANAVNDFITLPVYFAEAGSYSVAVRVKRASNGGRFLLGTSATTSGFSEFPASIESYSSTSNFTTISIGTRTFAVGKYNFRFRVTGKASASSGYKLYSDYIQVIKL